MFCNFKYLKGLVLKHLWWDRALDRTSTHHKTARASFWSSPTGSLIHPYSLHLLPVPGPILLVSSRLTKLGSWNFWPHFQETYNTHCELWHHSHQPAVLKATAVGWKPWTPDPIGGPHNNRNALLVLIFILFSIEYTFFVTLSEGHRLLTEHKSRWFLPWIHSWK